MSYSELQKLWKEYDKKAKDYREKGDEALLRQMIDAYGGLILLGWRDIESAPRDGTRFLAVCLASTGVFVHYEEDGLWWAEAHGDLWPSKPILWKPIPDEKA